MTKDTPKPCKCRCGELVVHGENGLIYGPPPWNPDAGNLAECYNCEIQAEQEAIAEEQERLVEAAMRAGMG